MHKIDLFLMTLCDRRSYMSAKLIESIDAEEPQVCHVISICMTRIAYLSFFFFSFRNSKPFHFSSIEFIRFFLEK